MVLLRRLTKPLTYLIPFAVPFLFGIKLTIAFLLAMAGVATWFLTLENLSFLADPSKIDDFHGVKAATYAMYATTMLALTMIRTGDRPADGDLDTVVRLGSLALAFLSGSFWLEGALGEFSWLNYFLVVGAVVLASSIPIVVWTLPILVVRSVRTLLRHIRG